MTRALLSYPECMNRGVVGLHDIAFQHKMELMVFGPRLRSAKWRKIGNREVDPSYWSTIVNRVKKLLGLRSLNFHSNSTAQIERWSS